MRNLAKTFLSLVLAAPLAACGGAGTDRPTSASGLGGGSASSGTGSFAGGGGSGGIGGSTGGGTGSGSGGGGTYPTIASLEGDRVYGASTGEIVLKNTKLRDRVDYRGFGETVEYYAATNTYNLDGIGVEYTDFTPDPAATLRRITISDANGELLYSRLSRWDHGDSNGRVGFVTYGVATLREDAPSGSITYRQVGFQGAAFRTENGAEAQYDLKNSTINLKYDFTTFKLDLLMNLIGTPLAGGGPDQSLGLFAGKNNVGGKNDIDGLVVKNGTDTVMGSFFLRFYGPGAAEYGLAFGLNASSDLKAAGAAAGRRQ
ncbi:hypothetical protein GCM10022211_05770 [Sphingomonas humi]|uniref:Transferrin-binding protein B C-lobe/N-lobe beta barrel domain-containing protein n=1 Tax=Sphingomonas humi TaxID=335630 RepID=A0ABP7RKJ6_9SPHN